METENKNKWSFTYRFSKKKKQWAFEEFLLRLGGKLPRLKLVIIMLET